MAVAGVSSAKSQFVEEKGEAVLKRRRLWESVGWHIDLAFSLRRVALTNDLSVQCIFRTSGIQGLCV